MSKTLFALAAIAVALAAPAAADSITSINGVAMSSTNSGTITSNGTFNNTPISGGRANFVGSSSTGAQVNVQIVKDGVDPNAATNDSIGVSSITALNKSTGTVSANGTFNGGNLASSNSNGNSMGVSAAGTSVNISIIHR